MKNVSIDDRMKSFYEVRNRNYLTRRTPVIIRIDGKAFHTYTRGLNKPFDNALISDMQRLTLFLCQEIQGCKFGYTQSDEISLLLTDYDTIQTSAWFDYCQNKMESIAASLATGKFNQLRCQRFQDFNFKLAFFDARSFNIPTDDVVNYFIWRQQDATKNSVSMLAQSLYSPKELHGKNNSQMQDMCIERGINWNDLSTVQKRGTAVYKRHMKRDLTDKVSLQSLIHTNDYWESDGRHGIIYDGWDIDSDIPIFSKERNLIDSLI